MAHPLGFGFSKCGFSIPDGSAESAIFDFVFSLLDTHAQRAGGSSDFHSWFSTNDLQLKTDNCLSGVSQPLARSGFRQVHRPKFQSRKLAQSGILALR
jgi:hypothetical protein